MADARHLLLGRSQAGDRHIDFHEIRDNISEFVGHTLDSAPVTRFNVGGRPATVSRPQPYAVTVFAEMSALDARIGAVNLGQGSPVIAMAGARRVPVWIAQLRQSLQAKRDKLAELGFGVHDGAGTYFLCADPRPLDLSDSTSFCAQLQRRGGVAAIPMSTFCDPGSEHAGAWNHLVRFEFCKRDDTLDKAIRRLCVQRSKGAHASE